MAHDLLGRLVVTRRSPEPTVGRIVEVEAYGGPEDPASHAGKYRAGRAAMFGTCGLAYVYRSYGIHAMLNIVAHSRDESGAVLIRALEPIDGLDTMRLRRAKQSEFELCNGPGRLCQALDIRFTDNGLDLISSMEVCIERGSPSTTRLRSGRIGISIGQEALWRLFVADNRFVSMPRSGVPFSDSELVEEAAGA